LNAELKVDLAKLKSALERTVAEGDRAELLKRRHELIERFNERCDSSGDCLY